MGVYGPNGNNYGTTYIQPVTNFASSEKFRVSRFARNAGHAFDTTPPGSDFDRGSANHNKPQYDHLELPTNHEINAKASMISMVSETYEFVDFTDTKTLYKDRVPRNKQNSPGLAHQPIVHLNREELFDSKAPEPYAEDFLAQFDAKKKVSPLYESSAPTYDFSPIPGYTYGDFSKPPNTYDYIPQTDIKQVAYSSPKVDLPTYNYAGSSSQQ